jgi:chemotaxis protein methyltransferase WspC
MSIAAVATAIREQLGLDPDSLGSFALSEAVNSRVKACGVRTTEAYLKLLAVDAGEREQLAAELAVPETWFFRGGRGLFDRLAEFLSQRFVGRGIGHPLRVLSLPCSTGEEPYSLAISLHEHAAPPGRVEIDAVDLSPRHIQRSVAAQYPAFSFRELGPDIRAAYFRQSGDRWELLPHIRERVRFRVANMADAVFLPSELPYDLIICRNVFIYLTPSARSRAMENLDRLLARDGWFCLTPGEADRLPPGRFKPVAGGEYGIYRRATPDESTDAESLPSFKTFSPHIPPQSPLPSPRAIEPPPSPQLIAVVPESQTDHGLRDAQALADAGRLNEALALCEQVIRRHATSARAYTLRGVIQQSQGKLDEAAESFRRALYLEPDHLEAISHMIVNCDRKGNLTLAAALRRRFAKLTGNPT